MDNISIIFNGSNQTIGILLLKFDNYKDMDNFFDYPEKQFKLFIEK
jgi:hypothetical protein